MSNKLPLLVSVVALGVAGAAFWKVQKMEHPKHEVAVGGFVDQVEKALLERPEIVLKAATAFSKKEEKKQAAALKDEIKKNKKDLTEHAGDPVGGNPNGDVTMVEFFDYRCGYCRRAYGMLHEAVKNDGNVKVIYKEFPIFGGEPVMAKAALAAHMQGKYDAFHKALMTSKGNLTMEELTTVAEKLGLDVAKWKKDMESADVQKEIDDNIALAQKLGVNGTPTLIINDEVFPGMLTVGELEDAFGDARK